MQLSRLGADVVARMAREVATRASAVRLQLLASQFYEALKLELERTPRHEARKVVPTLRRELRLAAPDAH